MAAPLLLDLALCTHFVCLLTSQFWIGPGAGVSFVPQDGEKICTVDGKNWLRWNWKWNFEY